MLHNSKSNYALLIHKAASNLPTPKLL
jgi:hypothetical protein